MALCNECFEDFVHPLTHEAIEKNKRVKERFGKRAHWDWNDEAVTLTFSDPENSTLVIDVERVREFGESRGYEQLTSNFLEADEFTGWEMAAVAAHVLNALGTYRFPTDQGYCYLVYREITAIPKGLEGLWGAMRGKNCILEGVDITEPTGEVWEAEQDQPNPSTNT